MWDAERTEQREHAVKRLEIVEALVLATSRRTEVLEVISGADEIEDAERELRDLLGVGEIPAKAVMDAQLRLFTSRQRAKLASNCDQLRAEIAELE
jgi:DNA gyrase subunit A